MKIKKILSAVMSTAMCFSIFSTNVTANNVMPTNNLIEIVYENSNGSQPILNQFENEYRYEDIADISTLNYIPNDTSNYGIMAYSDNSAPIAGLTYAVANPESLVNGKFTTDTIVYWLWNDGTTAYTYDPDGDPITNIFIDGIYDYILGNVTINDEVVGFATKITVPAEHELFFQVTDSNENYSNIVYYNFDVESADGNTRPICNIIPSNTQPYTNTPVFFDWSTSYDNDDNDTISNVKVKVYEGTNILSYELIDANSDYYYSMNNYGIYLQFNQTGTYQVWIALSDNHNAWSNWCISTINVQNRVTYVFEDLVFTSEDVNNSVSDAFTWIDYGTSVEYANESNNPAAIYDMLKSNEIPSAFSGRTIIEGNWSVHGYVKTSTGIPLSNATVKIRIPMAGNNFEKNVTTNSNGYFSYTCSSLEEWFTGWNQEYNPVGWPNYNIYGMISNWCRYGNNGTTSWMHATNLYVICESAGIYDTYPVTALKGCAFVKYLGNRWIKQSNEWIDLG